MSSVLIYTFANDDHARYVSTAIEILGYRCDRIFTADFPTQQSQTIYLNDERISFNITDSFSKINPFMGYKSVWLRRNRRPYIHNAQKNTIDDEFLRITNSAYHSSVLNFLDNAFSETVNSLILNTPIGTQRGESKLLQLYSARKSGFLIPNTLITNDMKEVSKFINSGFPVIRKSFVTYSWHKNGKAYINYASEMSTFNVSDVEELQLCSEIYQEKMENCVEIRSFIFGRTIFSIEIISDGKVDWRRLGIERMKAKKHELPIEVMDKIFLIMEEIGILTASFDLMRRGEDYIFLELNQGGLFLWMEYLVPELKILDSFSRFLLSGNKAWTCHPSTNDLTLERVMNSPEYKRNLELEKNHVQPDSPYI